MTVISPVGNHSSGTWDLSLNKNTPTDLTFNMGAGEANLDLTNLSITSLKVNGAVGKVTVVLPQKGNYSAQVNGAIGEIVLVIPKGLSARITANNAIASLQVQGDLTQDGKVITTPGFTEADPHIEVQLSIAIGGVVVKSE
jgi:predicted membrane protein